MIVCFECPDALKRDLDKLIESGACRDYSEFILLAVSNQMLLHRQIGGSVLVHTASARTDSRPAQNSSQAEMNGGRNDLFRLPTDKGKKPHLVQGVDDVFDADEIVPPERWIFGQYNRLLPAKATCRALANLLNDSEGGVDLGGVAIEIARAARMLGEELEHRSKEKKLDRDDQLSVAFPLGASAEKGIARYSNHFVGSLNNRGQLSGLPASLKLVGRVEGKKRSLISLTEQGWRFALLRNACIDDSAITRFTPQEKQFLCRHIREHVPQEVTAFSTLIALIREGHDTPDKLDKLLRKRVSKAFDASDGFVSTQRSGAISRMSDLELIDRHREGTRVSYVVTEQGAAFEKGALND